MKDIIVDWQNGEHITKEIYTANFKFRPLNIYTKDGSRFEMDARVIIQTDDDSIFVENFDSSSILTEMNILISNFFMGKDVRDIFHERQKIQDGLVEILNKEFIKYNAKVCKFMIVYMGLKW